MKYCKDCKYCERDLWCNFPDKIDVVTGEPSIKFCRTARNNFAFCGIVPKWFEKKEIGVKKSLFSKIISLFE